MKTNRELRNNDILFHHSISTRRSEEFELHCHNYYEVYFFISGDARYLVEGVEYRPEPYSLLLMAPNVFHGIFLNSSSPYERYALHLLPSFLPQGSEKLLLSPFHQKQIYYTKTESFHMESYFEALLQCCDMEGELQNIAVQARVEALLSQIVHLQRESIHLPEQKRRGSYTPNQMISYINEHIREPLSLDDLSLVFYIGKNQLNRTFRVASGTTINRYINQKRATMARQYILDGLPPSEACRLSGFQDYSNFFRAYKKIHGYSPADTRNTSLWTTQNVLEENAL